jgi:hypothetical protein
MPLLVVPITVQQKFKYMLAFPKIEIPGNYPNAPRFQLVGRMTSSAYTGSMSATTTGPIVPEAQRRIALQVHLSRWTWRKPLAKRFFKSSWPKDAAGRGAVLYNR